MWDACAFDEQTAATVGTIGVERYFIGFLLLEGLAVGHRKDRHFLPFGFAKVYCILDAGCRVEVVGRVLQTLPRFGSALILVAQQHHVLGGRLHLSRPNAITLFKVVFDFLSREFHDVELILVFVEIEQVGHANLARFDLCIVRKWSGK